MVLITRTLVTLVALMASAHQIHGLDVAPKSAPTMTKHESVYKYGQPAVAPVAPTFTKPATTPTTPTPATAFAYKILLTTDTNDSRVVQFNVATCVVLDDCLVGNIVNATWTEDLGSPSHSVVSFFSDAACGSPIITELPAPWSVDFRAKGDGRSPRSFAVGEWFFEFDYANHIVQACAAGV